MVSKSYSAENQCVLLSSDQRTADDESKSVNDNSKSEKFVNEVNFK